MKLENKLGITNPAELVNIEKKMLKKQLIY